MSLKVDPAGLREGGSRERRRGVVGKRWGGTQGKAEAEDPVLPTVKVNTRRGGTCGGLAQPKGSGRSWERRDAAAAAAAAAGSFCSGVGGGGGGGTPGSLVAA